MKLPIAKPMLIAIIAMIAIIGVSTGVMLGNQTHQGTQITQPVENQSQNQLNDSQMMDNLNKSPDELADDQKGYQGNEDLSSETPALGLTNALNVAYNIKKTPKHPIKPKPPVKPNKPPINNNNSSNNQNTNNNNVNDTNQTQNNDNSTINDDINQTNDNSTIDDSNNQTEDNSTIDNNNNSTVDQGNNQTEEPWDPLEIPEDNPDADQGNNGEDSGEDQSTDTGF